MDDSIIFLCPNGHKLSGPANLKGKPGQCPHCNAKFVIPDDAPDGSDSSAADPSAIAGTSGGGLSSLDDLGALGENEAFPPVPSLDSAPTFPGSGGAAVNAPAQGASQPDGVTFSAHPLKSVFEAIWSGRNSGEQLGIHLSDGNCITPEFYAQNMSGPELGVFALRDEDGTYTMTAVVWEAVIQISLGGVQKLPSGRFTS